MMRVHRRRICSWLVGISLAWTAGILVAQTDFESGQIANTEDLASATPTFREGNLKKEAVLSGAPEFRLSVDSVDLSARPVDHSVFREMGQFVVEIARAEHWQALANQLWNAVFENLFFTIIVIFSFLAGFNAYQHLLAISDATVKEAIRKQHISSLDASKLYSATTISALLVWLPLLVTGLWLCFDSKNSDSPDFLFAIGAALVSVFAMGVVYRLIHEFLSKGGLCEAIYGVSYVTARFILHRTLVAALFLKPLVALVVFASCFENGRWVNSVGRLSFLVVATLVFGQFHKFFWPHSQLYRRLENEESLSHPVWPKFRYLIYVAGLSVFMLATGLAISGWFALARAISIKTAATVIVGVCLFSLRSILFRKADELIRKNGLIGDLGLSVEADATLESEAVRNFVQHGNRTARQSINFLSVVTFLGTGFWIWNDLVSIPEQIFQLQLGNFTKAVQLVAVAMATMYLVRYLPGFVIWASSHHGKTRFENPRVVASLISIAIIFLGVVVCQKLTAFELPVIPWLGTLLAISILAASRTVLRDAIAGLTLIFNPRIREGDCIEVEGHFGRVAEVNLLSVAIEDNHGTITVMPNHQILGAAVIKSREPDAVPLIMEVRISRDADAHQAQAIMMLVAQRDACSIKDLPPWVRFKSFHRQEFVFEIRMLTAAKGNILATKQRILEKLAMEFERHGISNWPQDETVKLKLYSDSDSRAA